MVTYLVLLLLGLFLWAQIVEPTRKNKPLFPVFRKRSKRKRK